MRYRTGARGSDRSAREVRAGRRRSSGPSAAVNPPGPAVRGIARWIASIRLSIRLDDLLDPDPARGLQFCSMRAARSASSALTVVSSTRAVASQNAPRSSPVELTFSRVSWEAPWMVFLTGGHEGRESRGAARGSRCGSRPLLPPPCPLILALRRIDSRPTRHRNRSFESIQPVTSGDPKVPAAATVTASCRPPANPLRP